MATPLSHQHHLYYGLLTPQCYETFFTKKDFFNIACLRLLISKVLGYGIICGAVFVKIPQIVKIYLSRSSMGLELSMFALELIGYTITGYYNYVHGYPFSTYGENVFLTIQAIILCILVSYYQQKINAAFMTFTAIYLSFCAALYLRLLDESQLQMLQQCTILLFAGSKIPQIYSNFSHGHTGQLSIITIGLNFFGSLARVYTTIQEVEDNTILAGQLSGVTLNGILLLQILIYWNTTQRIIEQQSKQSKARTVKAL